jgi:uncharacterized protein (TIGR02145 family)
MTKFTARINNNQYKNINMKKYFFKCLIFIVCPLCFIACSDDHDDPITYAEIELAMTGSRNIKTVEVPVSGASEDWHIYSPTADLWLTFERVKGEAKLVISADMNTTSDVRESYIMIKHGGQTQQIKVAQDKYRTIGLSSGQLLMRYVNYTRNVTFNSDGFGPLTISIKEEDKGWLSAIVDEDSKIITVTTQQNDVLEERRSVIEISATELFSQEERLVELTVIQSKGGITPYYFDIPDFSESKVYKVMDEAKQVAQIAKEYLREKELVLAQAVVVYPVKEDGTVELDKGYVAQILKQNEDLAETTHNYLPPTGAVHGGQIIFDRESKKITSYTQGTVENPVTRVYMPGDIEMGHEEVPGSKLATVVPDLIEDTRGSESNIYPVVKIGVQYWMGKNLNTAYYNKEKSYEAIRTNTANGDFAYCCVYGYNDVNDAAAAALTNRERYGVLYSFLTIGGYASLTESGLVDGADQANDYLSPEGWIVPNREDITQLKSYVGDLLRLREFINYDTGEQILVDSGRTTDEGITGFAGRNGSYRGTNGTYTALGAVNGCWIWSRSYNNGTNAYLIHMTDIQSAQAIRRAASIRSIRVNY